MSNPELNRNVLEVKNLQVQFDLPEGVVRAVNGISFNIPQGGTVALVGESGSGKSVVSQAIMGILPRMARIAGGEILFHDPQLPGQTTNIAELPRGGSAMRQLQGGRISIIFQEPMTSLSPLHTIGDQITEALRLHRKAGESEARELTTDMLRLVGFPDPQRALRTYAFELSGGLRQRAMIAMALVCRPALLVADEPTTALDVTIQAQILKLLKDLQSELGMAVLMITHDLGVVANMADEIVVMYHGQAMERGGLQDIFGNPQHPYLKALLNAVPRFNMKPGERLVPLREIKGEVGTLLRSGKPADTGKRGEPLLEVEHVSKSFTLRKGGLFRPGPAATALAVDDISFTVQRGECLGLVGESGCGKTTASKLILRAIKPDSGNIRFNGADVLQLEDQALFNYRRQVQFIFQDPFSSLNPRMTVFDIVSEPLVIHKIGDEEERFQRVKELMSLVGLDPRFLRRYPHSFSGGQRQRIGIARALALQPELLICDEPVSALDVSIQAQILNLLKDLKAELGLTYLFISHNLAVVDYIADRIAVMCAGRLVELAPREQLFNNPVHPYTKALLAAVPKPDPNSRLDLHLLMEGKASRPADWPRPFTIDSTTHPRMVDVGQGHFVRADASADFRDLVA
ncbi:ABC transporter ATP-binding protein [Ferrovibrio terrae]|uniref:ABC transporter ATP-binding protein n=1 Tax=Ferrovibrio terrae TaxID=2594003 RepID=UPI003137C8CA